MLNIGQFRESIVQSTLKDLILDSPELEELLVFTCAIESSGGTYIRQINGSGLGIYQMQPETYNDIWQNYLKGRGMMCTKLLFNFDISFMASPERMIYDLRFATAMAAIFYSSTSTPYPKKDKDDLWDYYKNYYNQQPSTLSDREEAMERYYAFLHC